MTTVKPLTIVVPMVVEMPRDSSMFATHRPHWFLIFSRASVMPPPAGRGERSMFVVFGEENTACFNHFEGAVFIKTYKRGSCCAAFLSILAPSGVTALPVAWKLRPAAASRISDILRHGCCDVG